MKHSFSRTALESSGPDNAAAAEAAASESAVVAAAAAAADDDDVDGVDETTEGSENANCR